MGMLLILTRLSRSYTMTKKQIVIRLIRLLGEPQVIENGVLRWETPSSFNAIEAKKLGADVKKFGISGFEISFLKP
jgi:hypothetical protein